MKARRITGDGLLSLGMLLLALVTGVYLGNSPDWFAPDRGPPLVTRDAYQTGRALFIAKRCVTYHRHAQVAYSGVQLNIGPDLAGAGRPGSPVPSSPDYLRAWLKDPPAIRPGTQMPNLGLTDVETEYLLAFLLNSA